MAQASRPTLNVQPREAEGSRSTRRLRREGFVPGVVYGGGEDARGFRADAHEIERLLHSGAAVFDLDFGGEAIPVIVKDQQLHPVRSDLMHIDMLRVNLEALPGDIPERIDVDVSGLEAAGTLTLAEVSAPNGVTFLDDPEETVIATITIPTEVPEEPEIEEETGLVAEGEAAEGEEAEAAAEGATGDEAEASAGGEEPEGS
jgi:large subunit ribosomal protein L25